MPQHFRSRKGTTNMLGTDTGLGKDFALEMRL